MKYTFASEAHDSNNEYNHSTGKFTAPTAGRYMFLCNLAIEASASELTYAGIGVRKNNTGSVYFGGWADKQSTSAAHYAQASSSIIMYLAQGDYVELYIELSGSHTILGGNKRCIHKILWTIIIIGKKNGLYNNINNNRTEIIRVHHA